MAHLQQGAWQHTQQQSNAPAAEVQSCKQSAYSEMLPLMPLAVDELVAMALERASHVKWQQPIPAQGAPLLTGPLIPVAGKR